MDASVVICTRNRADSLARTLEALAAMARPAGWTWEVVVVDNGSTDATSAVLARFAAHLPLVAVVEARPGLSNARNRGVAAARGRYLLWTDDDVLVDPGWLAAYAQAAHTWPEAALFGGKVIPVLEEPVAAWFAASRDELAHLLAARDFGPTSRPLGEGCMPFGANYVVRAEEQRRFPYDPALGAGAGRNSRVGEETRVIEAVLAAGGSGVYVPAATVRHMISPRRQTFAHVLACYRGHGETAALNERARPARLPGGVPPWLLRRIAASGVGFAFTRLAAPPPVYVRQLKRLGYALGYADFLRAEAAGRRSSA
jgi:glycosyltransferase involved in cell wall biosynthesis